jgi:hypothetical protein
MSSIKEKFHMHNSNDVKVFEHVKDSLWKRINMNKHMVMISPLNDVLHGNPNLGLMTNTKI